LISDLANYQFLGRDASRYLTNSERMEVSSHLRWFRPSTLRGVCTVRPVRDDASVVRQETRDVNGADGTVNYTVTAAGL
jgi:hypothetical protein